jgi:hypothetical protein
MYLKFFFPQHYCQARICLICKMFYLYISIPESRYHDVFWKSDKVRYHGSTIILSFR